MKSQELKLAINLAASKAVVHALVIPSIIFTMLLMFKTEWAGLSFSYWLLPILVYTVSKKHDVSGKIFFRIVATVIAVVLLFSLLVVS